MSTAAMQAQALQACLAQGQIDLARRFFREAATAIGNPWNLTVGNDQRLSGAALPAPKHLLNWYMDKLQIVAARSGSCAGC